MLSLLLFTGFVAVFTIAVIIIIDITFDIVVDGGSFVVVDIDVVLTAVVLDVAVDAVANVADLFAVATP